MVIGQLVLLSLASQLNACLTIVGGQCSPFDLHAVRIGGEGLLREFGILVERASSRGPVAQLVPVGGTRVAELDRTRLELLDIRRHRQNLRGLKRDLAVFLLQLSDKLDRSLAVQRPQLCVGRVKHEFAFGQPQLAFSL